MKKNILLAFAACLFALFIAEIAIRLFQIEEAPPIEKPKEAWALMPERIWTEHHPELGWFHQKNKTAIHKSTHGDIEIHTNAAGFRGQRDYPKQKNKGIIRVAAVGDSFFFGYGVRDHQTFSAVLESKYPNLEVINLGIPGYGIDQLFLAYKTLVREYQPDYVLIGIFPEDFWRATRAFADTGHAKPYFSLSAQDTLILHNVPVPQPFTLKTNQFPKVIEYSLLESLLMHSRLYRIVHRGLIRMGKNLRIIDPNSTEEWILGRRILQEFIREVRNAGSEPVLVIVPPEQWVKREKPDSLLRSLRRFGQKENVPMIDLTPAFQDAIRHSTAEEYYIPNDGHWTPGGHQLVAHLIEDYLHKQNNLKL